MLQKYEGSNKESFGPLVSTHMKGGTPMAFGTRDLDDLHRVAWKTCSGICRVESSGLLLKKLLGRERLHVGMSNAPGSLGRGLAAEISFLQFPGMEHMRQDWVALRAEGIEIETHDK